MWSWAGRRSRWSGGLVLKLTGSLPAGRYWLDNDLSGRVRKHRGRRIESVRGSLGFQLNSWVVWSLHRGFFNCRRTQDRWTPRRTGGGTAIWYRCRLTRRVWKFRLIHGNRGIRRILWGTTGLMTPRIEAVSSSVAFLTCECKSNERVIAVGGNFTHSIARLLDGL